MEAIAYSTLVQPTLEYATIVWDPYISPATRQIKQEHGTTSVHKLYVN